MNAHPSLCTAFREVFVGMVSSTTCVFERSILSKRMKGKVAIGLVGSAASWFIHSSCCVRIQSRCWGVDLLERGVGCVAGRADELRGAAQQQQQPTGPNAPSIAASKKPISERTRMRSPACSIATRPIGVLNARGVFFGPEAPCSSSAQRSSLVPSYRHRAGSRSTSRGGTP